MYGLADRRQDHLTDDPDSPLALAAWLGLHPECGCPLDECRCPDVDADADADDDQGLTPVDILADVRLALRGTSEPVPDPLPAARARRRADDAMARIDAGERVFVGNLGVRMEEGQYMAGPLGPMGRDEVVALVLDLVSP